MNSKIISDNNLGWVINEKEFNIKYFNKIIKNLVLKEKIFANKQKEFFCFGEKILKISNKKSPNEILYKSIIKTISCNQNKRNDI